MREPALARAKVNLCLHVGAILRHGRWAGYHPVDSLVVFADFGDVLMFEDAADPRLDIVGPMGHGLTAGPDNLVLRALALTDAGPKAVRLEKHIPVSAGLGGGSANAAAALRHFDTSAHVDDAALGADIPVCRASRTARMQGIGERVEALPGLGRVAAVLVNPRVPVSTADIFKAFDGQPRAVDPDPIPLSGTLIERCWNGRNDLEPIAAQLQPVIGDVLNALAGLPRCAVARMSGSGASCFGLFPDAASADLAAKRLSRLQPDWWVRGCWLGDPS